MKSTQPVGVELGDSAVDRRELVGLRVGRGEQLLDAGIAGRRQQRS